MSYPSQPSYTPPYGQPQPPRQTNLWLVGSAIIAVLIIIMTVTLLIVQRTDESTEGGGGGPATTAEEEPTDDVVDPTDDSEEPTDDGGEPTDTGGDDGGDTGGEAAGFVEATCETFDMAKFEELYGEAPDPAQNYTSATSSGSTGSLTCSFYSNYDSSTISIMAWSDAAGAMEWWEDDKAFWSAEEDYVLTDFTAVGDAGYHLVFGEGETYQKRSVSVVVGALEFEVDTWIYPDQQDPAVADEYLQDMAEQVATTFADYA